MSKSFAHTLPENMQLTPTTKLLKSLSGQILPSKGIFHLIPITVYETKVYLSFIVFDIWEFDLLIRHPIERLLHEGTKGSINVSLRKSINLSIPLQSINVSHRAPDFCLKIRVRAISRIKNSKSRTCIYNTLSKNSSRPSSHACGTSLLVIHVTL